MRTGNITAREFMTKVVIPFFEIVIVTIILYPVCTKDGQCDYRLLWMLAGIPFGVRRMFLWVWPKNYDIGGGAALIALNFLAGGLIGGFVMTWKMAVAMWYLLRVCLNLVRYVI